MECRSGRCGWPCCLLGCQVWWRHPSGGLRIHGWHRGGRGRLHRAGGCRHTIEGGWGGCHSCCGVHVQHVIVDVEAAGLLWRQEDGL
jgi:hypothetical protein